MVVAVPVGEEAPRHNKHPLGVGASAFENYCTPENRDYLSHVLKDYCNNGFPYRVSASTHSSSSHTGVELAPMFVSELELEHALGILWRKKRSLHHVLVLYFYGEREHGRRKKLSKDDIGRKIGHSSRTVTQMIDDGLDELIRIIWRDA